MSRASHSFVLFKTELFVFHQPDANIDWWSVGADCAGWFYARLLPVPGIGPSLYPVMEDWGWTFSLAVKDVKVSVNVWAYFPVDNCWLFGVAPKKRLLPRWTSEMLQRATVDVCDALDNILACDSRILKHKWFAEDPFELLIEDF